MIYDSRELKKCKVAPRRNLLLYVQSNNFIFIKIVMVIFLLLQYIFKLYSTSKLKATWSHFIAQQFYYTRTAKDPQFNQQNYQIFSVYRNRYVSRFAIQRSRSTSTSTSTTASTTPCVATSSADREQIATSPEDDNRGSFNLKKYLYIYYK